MLLDQPVEDLRADGPLDAAETLDLVDRQVEARHLEILRPNPFTEIVHHSHPLIVRPPVREGNGHFRTPSALSDHPGRRVKAYDLGGPAFELPATAALEARPPERALPLRPIDMMTRLLFAAAMALPMACRSTPEPLRVAVTFANTWRVAGDELTMEERSRLTRAAFEAMRDAFLGFDVVIAEAPSSARLIRVEDTPAVRTPFFGAAGVTYPAARTSSVRFDVLANLELAVVHCRDLAHCAAMPRAALVDGLGRGVGATAAHELGHQAGFRFALDSRCDDCYDGGASTSYAHFFGRMHWSDRAVQIMQRTLPRRDLQTRRSTSTSPPAPTYD